MINYDQIDDEVTRLVNAISQGGGGGGSTVSVVSKRTTGENIADITVNNTTTQLYAPDSASDISFDPTVKGVYSGTNTQSVVDEITDDITSLNDTIKWKTLGTISGTSYIDIPSNLEYDELLICGGASGNIFSQRIIPKLFLTTADKFVLDGYNYYASGSTYWGTISYKVSTTKITCAEYHRGYGTTQDTSTASTVVYYR